MDTEHLSCAERRVSGLAVGDGRFFRAMVAPALKMSLSFKHMHVGGVLSVQVCMPCRSTFIASMCSCVYNDMYKPIRYLCSCC